jgi:hypothetical protein
VAVTGDLEFGMRLAPPHDATPRVILDAAQPAEGPMISVSLVRAPELSLLK